MTIYFIWEDGEGCDERYSWGSIREAEKAKVALAEDWADGEEVTAEGLAKFEIITAEELADRKAETDPAERFAEGLHSWFNR
jgi:hypothetical protein